MTSEEVASSGVFDCHPPAPIGPVAAIVLAVELEEEEPTRREHVSDKKADILPDQYDANISTTNDASRISELHGG